MVDERILEAIKDEDPVAEEPKTEVEVNNEPAPETTSETTPEQTPATQEVEAPVKTYTQDDWDKMTYSFKRQLGKQKDKFESQISDYNKRFTDFESRLNKLANPEKPLRRSDFETDDSYIEALINNGVEKRWAEREAKMREEYEKYEAERKAQEEQARELEEGIAKWYPDEAKRKEWYDTVSRAYGEGLQELLEKEQNVMNYLYQTPNQSLILYKLATDPQAVQSVFSIKNPLMRLMAVRDMENELVRERNNPAPVQAPVQTPAPKVEQANQAPAPVNNLAKAVGKPGAQVEATPDAFDNTDSLRDLLRKL